MPPSSTRPGYVVRRQAEAPAVPCPCGSSTRILTSQDGGPCSFHVTTIFDATRHYHRETTEVYYILTGTGKMELDGEWIDVEPGTVVLIEAGTRHRVVSTGGLQTVVVAMPPFREDDEYFD